ncbi:MAG TPA: sulfatase-like hydrolase/transferase [Chloroflexota bacterium]|nr:sulfatase-like hydrolase/transferase [Chloroflexota bacterium]
MTTRRPPNILLITTDEQRYDTLGSTSGGRVRTPNLDALAERGMRFTRGYIQNPVCIPSRACLMTGRYVHQHGVDHMQPEIATTPGLPPWEPAVMERLQGAGYRTAAFGKIHMMPPRGLDEMALTMGKGARWTVSSGSPLGPSQLGPVYAAWLEGKRPGAYEEIYAQRREPEYREQAGAVVNCLAADEYVDYWIGENTWQYLERLADTPERPFFAWCGFCGPHPPFDPPQPYASMYPIDEMPVPQLLRERQRNVPRSDRPGRFDGEDGEPLIRKLTAYYWGMMTFIDDMLGRIMEVLTRRGLWGNTLVIFTTDHGAMLGDFGLMGKGNFREQVIRVPYLVVPPGTSQAGAPAPPSGAGAGRTGGVYDGLVEHVDLVPTILDYAGLGTAPELPGQSLRPILEGRPEAFRPKGHVICEHGVPAPAGAIRRQQCLRTERYKYVLSAPAGPGEAPFVELYDLQEDPQERVNVAADPAYRDEVERHARLLIAHRLETESNSWKAGLAARSEQALDSFGLPTAPAP